MLLLAPRERGFLATTLPTIVGVAEFRTVFRAGRTDVLLMETRRVDRFPGRIPDTPGFFFVQVCPPRPQSVLPWHTQLLLRLLFSL